MIEKDPLLRVEHLSKRFPGVQALDDVGLEIYPGELVGLVGENGAGKSTLIKIISGVIPKDQGHTRFQGVLEELSTPQDAQTLGISTIHQELAIVPGLSVAKNLFLNREPLKYRTVPVVDANRLISDAQLILNDLGINVDANALVGDLTIARQQMVEIARAVTRDAKLILMDEPTSALSSAEVNTLFEIIARLKSRGVSVVFISHRLDEVLRIADRIVVMRDGRVVGTLISKETNEEQIVRLMVGRVIGLFPKQKTEIGSPILEIRNLSGSDFVQNVHLTINRGEIVGLAGLIGAGRTELARLICGADAYKQGEIILDGKSIEIKSPADAVRYGIGYIPENRKTHGLVLLMNVKENITLAILDRITRLFGFIHRERQTDVAKEYVEKLSILTPSLTQRVENLSGGNQQKVVLAKWLCSNPKVMIMDEPTRGIDVGAKAEVHALMSRLAREGMGILMISSELPEILGMSDRIVVMCQGRVTGEFTRENASQEAIMTCATQFMRNE